jgi:hypothetical protein
MIKVMKTLVLFTFAWLIWFSGFCQTPMYQADFYFQDAIGNRDTITIGYDTTANGEYNPQFGEINLSQPFDSVFEVRATHRNGINWGQPVSTSQSHNLNSAYFSPNSTVFLKVVVQDNQGNTALNIFEVSILDPSNSPCPRTNHMSYGTGVTSWVSSNPTKDFIQIGFSLPKSSNIEMSLNHAMGEPVTNIVKFYEAGEHLYPLSLIDYPSGLYFLHGKIGNASFHHKIIRQ